MVKGGKILLIIPTLKLGGGAEKIASILGTRLYEIGYDISYLTYSKENNEYNFKGQYFSFNEENLYSAGKIKGFKKLFSSIKNLFSLVFIKPKKIKGFCKKHEIVTIISFLEPCHLPILLSKVFLRNKCRIIVTLATNPNSHYTKSKNLFGFFLWNILTIRILFRKADLVIPVSKGIEKVLIEYGIAENKIKTIYNPIDINNSLKMLNEPLGSEYEDIFKDSFVFINIGRLGPPKGQWLLIKSFTEVVKKYNYAKLVILGEGSLERELKKLITRLKLEKNVFLLGVHGNIFPFIKNSNCFVFSSLWEGLPYVLIEALTSSIPIISTDCFTGPREILCPELKLTQKIEYPYFGRFGILTKPFSTTKENDKRMNIPLSKEGEMLQNLMIKIIEEKELRQNYSNGIRRAKDFDENKIIRIWENQINKKIS